MFLIKSPGFDLWEIFNFPHFRPGDLGHFLKLTQMIVSGDNNKRTTDVETLGEAPGREKGLSLHLRSSGLLEPWNSLR